MKKNYIEVGDNEILDWVKYRLRIFSDRELARILETSTSTISKIRRCHTRIGADILLRILDLTGIRLRDLPNLIKTTKSFDD